MAGLPGACGYGPFRRRLGPELLVREVLDAFRARFDVDVEEIRVAEESLAFKLPRELRDDAAG